MAIQSSANVLGPIATRLQATYKPGERMSIECGLASSARRSSADGGLYTHLVITRNR